MLSINGTLPAELLVLILHHVPSRDLIENCALVSKKWNCLARSLKHPLQTINLTSIQAVECLLNQLRSFPGLGNNVKSIRITLHRHFNKGSEPLAVDWDTGLTKILNLCLNVETILISPFSSDAKKLLNAITDKRGISTNRQRISNAGDSKALMAEEYDRGNRTAEARLGANCDTLVELPSLPNLNKIDVCYHHDKAAQKTYIDLNYLYRASIQWLRLELDTESACTEYLCENYGGIVAYLASFKNLTTLHISIGGGQPFYLTATLNHLRNLEELSLNCNSLIIDSRRNLHHYSEHQLYNGSSNANSNSNMSGNKSSRYARKLKHLTLSCKNIHVAALAYIKVQFPNLEVLCLLANVQHTTSTLDIRAMTAEECSFFLDQFVKSFDREKMKGLFLQLDFYTKHIRVIDKIGTKYFQALHDSFSDIAC